MAGYNGSGTWNRSYSWTQDANNGIDILPDRQDTEWANVKTGFDLAFCRDGQALATDDWDLGGFKIGNYGAAVARTDVPSYGQVQDGSAQWAGNAGGTGNAITLTPTPALPAYQAGQSILFKASATNTGATTIAISALAAKAIQSGGAALNGGEIQSGSVVEVVYDGTVFQLMGNAASQAGAVAMVRGVIAKNNTTTPNTKIDFTSADVVVMLNASNAIPVVRRNVGSLTCDTGTNAANGRDQAGALSNSSWVHFFYIWNPSSATIATLASASSSAPTLPSGYTHWAFITSLYKASGGGFFLMNMTGDTVAYEETDISGAPQDVIISGSATATTSFSLAAAVPTTAKSYQLRYAFGGRANNNDNFTLRCSTMPTGGDTFVAATTNIAVAPNIYGVIQQLPNLQTLLYHVSNASDNLDLTVASFRVKNGD